MVLFVATFFMLVHNVWAYKSTSFTYLLFIGKRSETSIEITVKSGVFG